MAFEELLVSLVSRLDNAGFNALDRMETRAVQKTNILSRQMKNLFVGVVGTMGVKSIVDATVKLDTLTTSMSALAGSEIGGKSQLEYLRKEADRLGQNFIDISDSYKNLFSAGKGVDMDEGQIQAIFSSVLEAGTVLGSSRQQMYGALLALEQMISKGKVSMEELRRQLGNALPGAMQIAARAMGTTSQGFQEMVKSGLDSKKFVTAFADQLHKEFSEKAVNASQTLRAALGRLNNSIFDIKTAFLDGEDTKALADAVNKFASMITNPALLQSLNAIGKVALLLVKNIRLISGVAVILGIRKLIDTVALLRMEFLTTTFAAGSFGAALQMDAGIASVKALSKATWGMMAPLVKITLLLGLIIELWDTLKGKKTFTSEAIKNLPTPNEFVKSKKGQNLIHDAEKNMWMGSHKDLAPFYGLWGMLKRQKFNPAINPFENTLLQDSGLYKKDGSVKDPQSLKRLQEIQSANGPKMYSAPVNINSGAITINVPSGDPQMIAAVLKNELGNIFKDYTMTRFNVETV